MKINKKIVNTVLALAIAVPMMGSLTMGDAFADGIVTLNKIDDDKGPVANAEIGVYKDGKLYFTIKTDANGKVGIITGTTDKIEITNGSLKLANGSYEFKETVAPAGYLLNSESKPAIVSDNSTGNIEIVNYKVKSDEVPVYIKATNLNGAGVAGAKIDLIIDNKVVATFTSDANGKLLDEVTVKDQTKYVNIGAKVVNGVLLMKSTVGDFTIKESAAPSGYPKNDSSWSKNTSNKNLDINIVHSGQSTNPTDPTNPTNPTNPITTDTGLKLNVIDKMYDGLQNVKLGVYRVDSKGKIIEKVFSGKTGKDGLPDIGNTTIGKDLIAEGGVLDLKPGKYMYRIENVDGMKKHYVDIKQGQVAKRTFRLSDSEIGYLNTNKANGTVRSTSNNVSTTYGNAGTNNTKKLLAKTGSENPIAYTLTGLALAASGAFIFMKK